MKPQSGGCLCGKINFRTTGALRDVIACHCQQCRKTSGHHVAATSIKLNEIEITGDVTWFTSSKRAKRGFCAVCGSNLFWQSHNSDRISIFAGVFDGDPGLTLRGHIYTADKGDYYEINDGLPQCEGYDPDLTSA